MDFYPLGHISIPYDPWDQHVVIFGKSGSGKTYLLKNKLMRDIGRSHVAACWVYDSQEQYADLAGYGFSVTNSLANLPYGKVVFQPGRVENEDFDAIAERAFNARNLVLVVEEAHFYIGKYTIRSKPFEQIVKGGRPRGVTYVAVTIRPQDVHNTVITQASHRFCFQLEVPTDYDYLYRWFGPKTELLKPPVIRDRRRLANIPEVRRDPSLAELPLPDHSFVYRDPDGNVEVGRL